MLTEAYIEALLVDEELADLVWEAWSILWLIDVAILILSFSRHRRQGAHFCQM